MHFDTLKMGCFRDKRVFQQYRPECDIPQVPVKVANAAKVTVASKEKGSPEAV